MAKKEVKKAESNINKRDNSSKLKGKNIPENSKKNDTEEFTKSKLRNKGKGSNANLGGSLGDHSKKRKLL
jgi:hypothetical protein